MNWLSSRLILILFVSKLVACGGESTEPSAVTMTDGGVGDINTSTVELPTARFEPSEALKETPLGLVPYPNNIYLNDTGHIQLDTFAFNIVGSFVNRLLETLKSHVDGFACAGTHYLTFDGPIDTTLLPIDGMASLEDDSALILVDVDPDFIGTGRTLPRPLALLLRKPSIYPPTP